MRFDKFLNLIFVFFSLVLIAVAAVNIQLSYSNLQVNSTNGIPESFSDAIYTAEMQKAEARIHSPL